jgi:preprotein translocase subunit SecG
VRDFLVIIQIIVSLLLIVAIIIQSKGTGFGRSWGGASSFSRRGLEKLVFRSTFVLAAIFILLSLALILFF